MKNRRKMVKINCSLFKDVSKFEDVKKSKNLIRRMNKPERKKIYREMKMRQDATKVAILKLSVTGRRVAWRPSAPSHSPDRQVRIHWFHNLTRVPKVSQHTVSEKHRYSTTE